MNHVTWLAGIAAVAVLAVGSMGCNRFSAPCADAMDCVNGNDMDIDACIAEAEAAADEADAYDCATEFDALFECKVDRSHCYRDSANYWHYGPEASCDFEQRDLSDCEAHGSRLR
jgi:hypothetical protein